MWQWKKKKKRIKPVDDVKCVASCVCFFYYFLCSVASSLALLQGVLEHCNLFVAFHCVEHVSITNFIFNGLPGRLATWVLSVWGRDIAQNLLTVALVTTFCTLAVRSSLMEAFCCWWWWNRLFQSWANEKAEWDRWDWLHPHLLGPPCSRCFWPQVSL